MENPLVIITSSRGGYLPSRAALLIRTFPKRLSSTLCRQHADKLCDKFSTLLTMPSMLPPGLAQPGKIERGARASGCRNHLHQLHVCLPAGPGRSRLLYRMSMDFLHWTKHVPFIQSFWAHIAKQVCSTLSMALA